MPITKQDVARFGQSLSGTIGGFAEILKRNQRLGAIDQARQQAGPMSPEFLQYLLSNIGRSPEAAQMLQGTMALQPKFQALGADQTYGTVDPFTQKFTEQGKTDPRPMAGGGGEPTQLYKHQMELAAIRAANPKDPRIPEYEAVIKKLQIGVPGFQVRPGAEGQYLKFNSKTGEWEPTKGAQQYQPTPSQIRLAASQLQNVRQSAQKIKDLVGTASVTGPVTGRARKLGSRFFSDKDAQTLISTIGQLRPIIYGLSGKQINEAEQEWLTNEILPNLAQPDENFDVTLKIFQDWVDQTLGNMKSQFPSLDIPGGQPEFQEFTVDGKKYRIPSTEVDEFKREMGIK